MPGPIRWQVDRPSLTSERHALWRSVVPDMIAAADEGTKVPLASPCQHQDLWTPCKGNLTPFSNRYRKLANFRVADQPDRMGGMPVRQGLAFSRQVDTASQISESTD